MSTEAHDMRAKTLTAEPVTCPSCRATLLRGMRFCRMCGYRLGEGLEEYVETVRLDGMPLMSGAAHAPQTAAAQAAPTVSLNSAGSTKPSARRRGASCSAGGHWWLWVLVGVLVLSLSGGGVFFRSLIRDSLRGAVASSVMSRSFFGVSDFEDADGGALVESVLPGTPAEQAGLADGDVVTEFNGRPVRDADDLRGLLRKTPAGTSAEIVFLRDGETRRAIITTAHAGSYDAAAFAPRGGQGYWGVSGLERVPVPGTSMHGVELGNVRRNQPADIAGLREGDIVIEYEGRPVRTEEGLEGYIHRTGPGSTVQVVVMRDGQRVEIPVKVGRGR